MTKFEIPTYYGVTISFYEKDGKYFMQYSEWSSERTEISKKFYDAAIEEFNVEKKWK
ncbi:hypothetical protein ACYCSU_17305 [Paenibacillus sp. ALE1]